MRTFIFETHIPIWSNPVTLQERAQVWKDAGIDTVFLLADDGRGATWPSTVAPTDARIDVNSYPLRTAIAYLHTMGMTVIPVVNVIGIVNPSVPIRPEFYIQNFTPLYYDMWNTAFVQWRTDYIAECANVNGGDALAIDYIRTQIPTPPGKLLAHQLVAGVLATIRSKVSPSISIITLTNSAYYTAITNSQGVDPAAWYSDKLIDGICVFNYSIPFPVHHIQTMPFNDFMVLVSNYEVINNVAVPYPPTVLESNARTVIRNRRLAGIGWYNANQIVSNHLPIMRHIQKVIVRT